jgi:hypothetical protein
MLRVYALKANVRGLERLCLVCQCGWRLAAVEDEAHVQDRFVSATGCERATLVETCTGVCLNHDIKMP